MAKDVTRLIVSSICRHDLSSSNWPDLLELALYMCMFYIYFDLVIMAASCYNGGCRPPAINRVES